jgi:hypothetical protein
MAEVEEALKRLTAHKGVVQAVICNSDGIPIRTVPPTMEPKDATMFPAVLLPVVQKSKQMIAALAKLEGIDNGFSSIRLRSKKNEILVYPEVRVRATTGARVALPCSALLPLLCTRIPRLRAVAALKWHAESPSPYPRQSPDVACSDGAPASAAVRVLAEGVHALRRAKLKDLSAEHRGSR